MPTFAYRRELTRRELLPALGAGVGVGIAVTYLTQLILRREPLAARPAEPYPPSAERGLPGPRR